MKAQFVVAELSMDSKSVCFGSGEAITERYRAELHIYDTQISSDGEYGSATISLARSKRPFPWVVGQTVVIPIPWGDTDTPNELSGPRGH